MYNILYMHIMMTACAAAYWATCEKRSNFMIRFIDWKNQSRHHDQKGNKKLHNIYHIFIVTLIFEVFVEL